eukprot:TRINITY_DN8330_c0_g2_i3.p1 TRINITY_DN8330_c0_g2~~TRINITY_DN8330_c0_g2_i3.p1  ORF type:complete len:346 (+),score=32.08 TRINITY_DN8330_c0_g2_i3:217-1254(+)
MFIIMNTGLDTIDDVFMYISQQADGHYAHPFIEEPNGECLLCGTKDKRVHMGNNGDAIPLEFLQTLFNEAQRRSQNLRKSHSKLIKTDEIPQSNVNAEQYTMDCQVCYCTFNERVHFQGADHPICRSCLVDFLTNEISNGQVFEIKCPHCNIEMKDADLKLFLSTDTVAKYEKFRKNKLAQINPLARFCPALGCEGIANLKSKKDKKAVCPTCNHNFCPNCYGNYHENRSCVQVQKDDVKTWSKGHDVGKCPKCRMLVDKGEGCNHMTCAVCSYEWCWLCGSAYTGGHFSKVNPFGCPGLQSGSNSARSWGCCQILLYRVLILLAWILALPFLCLLYTSPSPRDS